MVPGWFLWFQVSFSWFQVGFSWFFMVFVVFHGFSWFFMVPGWFLWSQAGGLTTPGWLSYFLEFQVDVDDDDPH